MCSSPECTYDRECLMLIYKYLLSLCIALLKACGFSGFSGMWPMCAYHARSESAHPRLMESDDVVCISLYSCCGCRCFLCMSELDRTGVSLNALCLFPLVFGTCEGQHSLKSSGDSRTQLQPWQPW